MRNGKVRIIRNPLELGEVFDSARESRFSTRALAPPVDALSRKLRTWSPRSSENIFTLEVANSRVRDTVARRLGEILLSDDIKILLPSTDSATAVDLESVSDPGFRAVLFVSFGFSSGNADQSDTDSGPLNTLWLKQTEKQSIPFPAVVFLKHNAPVSAVASERVGDVPESGVSMKVSVATFVLSMLAMMELAFFLQSIAVSVLVYSNDFAWLYHLYIRSFLLRLFFTLFTDFSAALNFLLIFPVAAVIYWILVRRSSSFDSRLRNTVPLMYTGGLVSLFLVSYFYGQELNLFGPVIQGTLPIEVGSIIAYNSLWIFYGFIFSLIAPVLICVSIAYSTSPLMKPRTMAIYSLTLVGLVGSLVTLSSVYYLANLNYLWSWSHVRIPIALLPANGYGPTYLIIIGISVICSVIFEVAILAVWLASTLFGLGIGSIRKNGPSGS